MWNTALSLVLGLRGPAKCSSMKCPMLWSIIGMFHHSDCSNKRSCNALTLTEWFSAWIIHRKIKFFCIFFLTSSIKTNSLERQHISVTKLDLYFKSDVSPWLYRLSCYWSLVDHQLLSAERSSCTGTIAHPIYVVISLKKVGKSKH